MAQPYKPLKGIELQQKKLSQAIKPTTDPLKQKQNEYKFNKLQQLQAPTTVAPVRPVTTPQAAPGTTSGTTLTAGGTTPSLVTPTRTDVDAVHTPVVNPVDVKLKPGQVRDPATGKIYSSTSAMGIKLLAGGASVGAEASVAEEPVATYADIGAANIQADYDANLAAELDLFGEKTGYSSMDEYIQDQKKAQDEQAELQRQQLELQKTQIGEQVGDQKNILEGQVEAASGLVGSREGATSLSNVSAYDRLKGVTATQISRLRRDADMSFKAIEQAKTDLARAERAGNTALAEKYRSTLLAAESAAQQTETDLIDAQTRAVETEAAIRESEVNMQTTKGETVRSSITSLGALAGELDVTQLGQMIEGTDISFPEALLLQQATVLQAEADASKNDVEREYKLAQLAQIMGEIGQIGKTTDMQNYEYYNLLSEEGKKEYIKLQNATKGMQLVQGEDGSMYSFDPTSGTITNLPTASSSGGGTIPHDDPITATIGDREVTAQPVFMTALQQADAAMFAATGQHIQINQDFRSSADQQAIRDKFGYTSNDQASGEGGLAMAAPVGTSFHEMGLAVDVTNWEAAEQYLEQYGIVGGLEGDRGHFSMGEMNPEIFGADSETMEAQALALLQGYGGTAGERSQLVDQMTLLVNNGQAKDLTEAKKIIGFKTEADDIFIESTKEELKEPKAVFTEISNKLDSLPALLESETGIGDVAAIVNFLKTIDPNSVARESEVASVQNAVSVGGQIEQLGNRLANGKKLTDEQRVQLMDAVKIIKSATASKLYEDTLSYKDEFDGRGLEFTLVTDTFLNNLKSQLSEEQLSTITTPQQDAEDEALQADIDAATQEIDNEEELSYMRDGATTPTVTEPSYKGFMGSAYQFKNK